MNRLSTAARVQILTLLCEGMAMRAIERTTGASINTISKLLCDAGEACLDLHDEKVRGLKSKRVQADEIWSFNYAKQKNVAKAKAAPADAGDVWTWTALDADSKLIVSYAVGDRTAEYANWFMQDVASRIEGRIQLTTDGHRPYLQAVEGAFGADIDYAMLVKLYGGVSSRAPEVRYSPAECIGAKPTPITGEPEAKHISTSFVERSNLSMRMHMRRFTRLTNAHSKKFQNHVYALALYFAFYNFTRQHKAHKLSPAMAAGIADRLWNMEDIVALIDAREPPPKKRGPYKKRKPSSD